MTRDDELARFYRIACSVLRYQRTMRRRHPDGTVKTPEEIKAELTEWIRRITEESQGTLY